MKNKENQTYKYLKSIRGSWGDISPVTRIKESRKIYNRKKSNSNKYIKEYREGKFDFQLKLLYTIYRMKERK